MTFHLVPGRSAGFHARRITDRAAAGIGSLTAPALALIALTLPPSWASAEPSAAVSSVSAAVTPAGVDEFVDNRLGIKLGTPKAWSSIPMGTDERWKVAKFLSDKTYFYTEKGGWTNEHKPTMEVIAFVTEATKAKIKVDKKEDKDGSTTWRIFSENPYKDYKDFLTRRYSGGGWFVSEEKEIKVGDIPVTLYEIKVEKLSYDGPKRLFTYVYHVPDVDIAVQFEVLENAIDKLKNEVNRCLKSFKSIPRSGEALYEASTPDMKELFADESKMTQAERQKHRSSMEQRAHEKAAKTVTDGWTAKKMGRFMVLNHADEKYAQRVVTQAEAVWDWLDKTFSFIGPGEYVRSPILRICKNEEEQRAFLNAGGWFSRNDIEITTCQDYGGSTSWEMEWVNRRVKDVWFRDKDIDLQLAMPGWLSIGLDNLVGKLHAKNGKVEFGTDFWDRDDVKEQLRLGKLTQARELMVACDEVFWTDWNKRSESACLFAYFASGAASKQKRTKDILPEYMKNVLAVALDVKKENEAKKEGDGPKKPKTEAEEDEMFKNQQQGYKKAEKRLLDEAFSRTFVGWTSDDWKKFQEAYEKTL